MQYKDLYKKIVKTVHAIEVTADEDTLVRRVLDTVVREYGSTLGITSGRLYVRENGKYVMREQIGVTYPEFEGLELSMDYQPIRKLREDKYIIMDNRDLDSGIEAVDRMFIKTFAAIAIGSDDRFIVSFSVDQSADMDQLHYSLNTVRFVTNFKLRELILKDEIMKAREIQVSLLPTYHLDRTGFDMYGRSVPAKLVGGDAFDYLPLRDDSFGVAVLDAVGHGLPAALQARDVITGLRMGVATNLKMETMMVKLNQVIHRSNMASRFVSLFYGEMEEHGHFIYINAGHPPPMFFSGGSVHELRRGGMVLGPNPAADYFRGFAFFQPGDVLAVFSDGIYETRNPAGEMFGRERLQRLLGDLLQESAHDIVDRVFATVESYCECSEPSDDQTVVIVKYVGVRTVQF